MESPTHSSTRARPGAVRRVAIAVVLLFASGCGDDDATSSPPATADDATTTTAAPAAVVTDASVTRLEDGRFELSWSTDPAGAAVDVFWSEDPDAPDEPLDELVGVTSGSAVVDDPTSGGRPYFRIVSADDDGVTVAERRIDLEGQHNFRDLGGYETTDGRRVRWGQLYRSGELGELTADDISHLTDVLGIRLVCDLRSPGEVEELPDPELPGAERISLSIVDDSVDPVAVRDAVLAGDLSVLDPGLLVQGNQAFVRDMTDQYASLMDRVTDPENWPTNIHCTAGKDRAGWGSAVILLALGVPEETVMEDYLLTNEYTAEENAANVEQVRQIIAATREVDASEVTDEDLEPLLALVEARREYLQAALDTIDEEYGGLAGYLNEGLELTDRELNAFRDAMLE